MENEEKNINPEIGEYLTQETSQDSLLDEYSDISNTFDEYTSSSNVSLENTFNDKTDVIDKTSDEIFGDFEENTLAAKPKSLEEQLHEQDEFAFLNDLKEEDESKESYTTSANDPDLIDESTNETKIENPQNLITVRPVKFQEFEPTNPNRTIKKNLDIMQDVSMHISVELGRTKLSIREVIEMEEGSVVELDKIAGEQVEVFVNEKLVAKGEVIVIEDKFGVRITSTNIQKQI